MKTQITLKDFAAMAGVTVFRCEPEWGGTWAYKVPDAPHITFSGYRSEAATYKAWASDTFGPAAAEALTKLLASASKKKEPKHGTEQE